LYLGSSKIRELLFPLSTVLLSTFELIIVHIIDITINATKKFNAFLSNI
jgi:hypothetical protein